MTGTLILNVILMVAISTAIVTLLARAIVAGNRQRPRLRSDDTPRWRRRPAAARPTSPDHPHRQRGGGRPLSAR